MSREVEVVRLPSCDICKLVGNDEPAEFDGKVRPTENGRSPWAYMCMGHFILHGIGLGTGKGQRLILKE
jgi:hypothetical protein